VTIGWTRPIVLTWKFVLLKYWNCYNGHFFKKQGAWLAWGPQTEFSVSKANHICSVTQWHHTHTHTQYLYVSMYLVGLSFQNSEAWLMIASCSYRSSEILVKVSLALSLSLSPFNRSVAATAGAEAVASPECCLV
jgi:hypothetical protein